MSATLAAAVSPATIAASEAAKAAARTEAAPRRFIAAALESMGGNVAARTEAAALAVGRGVYLAIESGNMPPLEAAAASVYSLPTTGKLAADSRIVAASFAAAMASAAPALLYAMGKVQDTRKGIAKRGGKETAAAAEAAAIQGFTEAAKLAAVAEAAAAEAAKLAKKAKAEAAKLAAVAEAAEAEAAPTKAEAAEVASLGLSPLAASVAALAAAVANTAVPIGSFSTLAEAEANMLATAFEKNPAIVNLVIAAAAIMQAQRTNDKAEAWSAFLAADRAKTEAALLVSEAEAAAKAEAAKAAAKRVITRTKGKAAKAEAAEA